MLKKKNDNDDGIRVAFIKQISGAKILQSI